MQCEKQSEHEIEYGHADGLDSDAEWLYRKKWTESSERMQEILDGNDTCKSHESQQVCVSAKWRK